MPASMESMVSSTCRQGRADKRIEQNARSYNDLKSAWASAHAQCLTYIMDDRVPDGGPALLHLTLLLGQFAICRLPACSVLPEWATEGAFSSVSWTTDETSVVCEQASVPAGIKSDAGWRAFKAAGPMDFSLKGVLLSIAKPLADAEIGIFAVSTFDTDYVLVKGASLDAAVAALTEFGHTVVRAE
jgi:uncharacterized protein